MNDYYRCDNRYCSNIYKGGGEWKYKVDILTKRGK